MTTPIAKEPWISITYSEEAQADFGRPWSTGRRMNVHHAFAIGALTETPEGTVFAEAYESNVKPEYFGKEYPLSTMKRVLITTGRDTEPTDATGQKSILDLVKEGTR